MDEAFQKGRCAVFVHSLHGSCVIIAPLHDQAIDIPYTGGNKADCGAQDLTWAGETIEKGGGLPHAYRFRLTRTGVYKAEQQHNEREKHT